MSKPETQRPKRDGPERDERAEYDYVTETTERPGLVDDLDSRVDGDVRFDDYSRQMYATDASAYEKTPIGVVFPTSTADVSAVMTYCARREIPVLPRGGGTSLAGQAVNEAVVLDFTRYMDDVLAVDPEAETARAAPGVTLSQFNATLEPHDLKFAPDPAAGNRSVLGGAIGNNSTGSHSLQYGKTDAYVESVEAVLADGTVTTFGEMTLDELRSAGNPDGDLEARIYDIVRRIVDEEADAIDEAYPDLKRNVSGYNLDRLVDEADKARDGERETVNVARVLAGSEGTLSIITEAEVSLEPIPETKSVALLTYDDLLSAMEDVAPILEHDPAAVEVLDDVLIDLARDTEEFADVVAMLPEGTGSVLLVEFYAENDADGRQKVDGLFDDRLSDGNSIRANTGLEAHDDEERARFWKLRKSGMPILLSRTSDAKHISFIEDVAIPPENLPEYVADFQDVLEENNTFASFYAHAGPGCLHIRPLIDTKSPAGIEQMEALSDAVTDLVVKYDGSVSGEHGDGRARTQWNRKLYGDHIWQLFREVKTAFDPDWLLNPGQVCGYDKSEQVPDDAPERVNAVNMTEDLRFDPEYEFDAGFDPSLHWKNENGMQGMVELCHGCGGCRGDQETTGGVMCPTFRAADEEITSTRGRANMLRQAMSGDLPDEPTDEEFVTEVMDLCIGCKGCARDCPSEVDMAKLKTEVVHEYHQKEGASLRERAFANVDTLARIGSALAPISNWAAKIPGARTVLEQTVGIASERTLPTFERESLRDWFADRGPQVSAANAERRALLFPDTYTNFSHPEVGKAAVRVLEAAGVHVKLANVTDSGRPAHSKGFVDVARETAREAVDALEPHIADGWDVVVVEPSDAVMLQSDYHDLLSGDAVDAVSTNTYGVCEYLDAFRLDENVEFDAPNRSLAYHGHCHQKATKKDHHAVGVLRRAGYAVDALDSGCCGMAGSFGYESEHYAMSQAIGDTLVGQVEDSGADVVVAPGASCRTQLGDAAFAGHAALGIETDREEPPTPIETLAAGL